jgi:hypothetical protein
VRRGLPLRQRMRRSRVLGWERNPVRRRIDRIEGFLLAALVALFLITAPVLAGVAGRGIHAAGLRQQHAEASWRPVSATVERGVAPRAFPRTPGFVGRLARWTAPDGQPRSGWIVVSSSAGPGSRSREWVDGRGALTGPPLRRAQVQQRTSTARALTACGLAVLLVFVGAAGRHLLRRRRLAAWDKDWQAVEPWWTKRRP